MTLARRTHHDVRVDTIVAERAGLLTFARRRRAEILRMADAGKVPLAEAELLARRIMAFADDIATGLHLDGDDPHGVRDRMRSVVRGSELSDV